ncbi:MAG: phenylalanine--tRNA ligase subunit beta [Epsilonproteobacteria bacterium]|nr:phenylalanine--tRNA ligase subunit beta [Campylobacterota bacterium]
MKLSLAWIFDHIDASWQDIKVDHLVSLFNTKVAEIEEFYHVNFDLSSFFIGTIKQRNGSTWALDIAELGIQAQLPEREAPVPVNADEATIGFIVKKTGDSFAWATLADFKVDKDGLLPALYVPTDQQAGAWRNKFACEDIIIDIDNKSITHRPDMWGHRGFAREIAALLNLPFLPGSNFLQQHPVKTFEKKSTTTEQMPFTIENQAPELCSRFAGLYFSSVHNKPSDIFMASRLMAVGARPINLLVDLTNYLTHDWSQPVHAYDADKIGNKSVVIRRAKNEEELLLLGDEKLSLTTEDLVIADAQHAMCLAGVKGGFDSSVSEQTTKLFFEAANFDAESTRRSSQRNKVRTDSSARFEKTLDSMQTTQAISRFLSLAKQFGMDATPAEHMVVVGAEPKPVSLDVSHEFLEQRSGISLSSKDVVQVLEKIEFGVQSRQEDGKTVYHIDVPSFRASKDVDIKEDILEEVVRFYGFDKVPLVMPRLLRRPFNLAPIMRRRKIKQFLAQAAGMIEQQNYTFFDEQFLSQLELTLPHSVEVANPISDNYVRLASSIIPALLKNIADNHVHHDKLSFFELSNVWLGAQDNAIEQQTLAGIFFAKRSDVDFYECKTTLNHLFTHLDFATANIRWKKPTGTLAPWFRSNRSADIFIGEQKLGTAGNIDQLLLKKLDIGTQADAFVFELNAELLINTKPTQKRYQHLSKFQDTYFDISLLAPLTLTQVELDTALQKTDALITRVELIDFFEKDEWTDVRSLTFRVWLGHDQKTLLKQDIDTVHKKAIETVQALGAQARTE